jgi:hypothetical protein
MHHRRFALFVASALVASVALATASGPASAAPLPINLAGYQQSISGPTASTDVLAVVPKFGNCPALATFQAAVAGSVIQASTGNSGGGVAMICANGVSVYLAQTQVDGQSTLQSNAINAGDLVRVQTTVAPTSTSLTLSDLSKGWSISLSGGGGTPTAAGVGMVAGNCGNGCSPIPAFSGSAFIASLNGGSLTHAVRSNVLAADGTAQATAGNALLGLAFGVTYRFSCTPADPNLNNRC